MQATEPGGQKPERDSIAARANHSQTSLADLYNPLAVPSDILSAHRAVDLAVDRAFTALGRPSTVTDRMRILFPAYAEMQGELMKSAPVKRRCKTD